MNFPASPHAFTALGVGAGSHAALGLHPPSLPLSLPQRNPFAIQELLGLSPQTSERCRPSVPTSSDSFLSASAFLASSFSPPLSVTSVTSGLNSSAFPYMAWKSSFMNALNNSAHGLLNFGSSMPQATPPSSLLSKTDFKTGLYIYYFCTYSIIMADVVYVSACLGVTDIQNIYYKYICAAIFEIMFMKCLWIGTVAIHCSHTWLNWLHTESYIDICMCLLLTYAVWIYMFAERVMRYTIGHWVKYVILCNLCLVTSVAIACIDQRQYA